MGWFVASSRNNVAQPIHLDTWRGQCHAGAMRYAVTMTVLASLLASTPAMGDAGPKRVTKIVEVNGKRYRVVTLGNAVMVANKAFYVAYDVNERDDQRNAVKAATGCQIVDELPSNDAKLRGKLDCSNQQ